jgi:hypothetical protein
MINSTSIFLCRSRHPANSSIAASRYRALFARDYSSAVLADRIALNVRPLLEFRHSRNCLSCPFAVPGHPTRVILKQIGDRVPRRSLSGSLRRACSDQPDATDPRRSNPSTRVGQGISFYAVPQSSLNPIIVIFVARFFLELRTRDVLFMSGFRGNIY